jgi:hypothetical protein
VGDADVSAGSDLKDFNKRPRVIVCGTRTFTDKVFVFKHLTRLLRKLKNPVIATGAARGVDASAEDWAYRRMLTVTRFHLDWDRHGKAAGPIRNGEMGRWAAERRPAFCVAFWDGRSTGTKDMVDKAKHLGIKTIVVRLPK